MKLATEKKKIATFNNQFPLTGDIKVFIILRIIKHQNVPCYNNCPKSVIFYLFIFLNIKSSNINSRSIRSKPLNLSLDPLGYCRHYSLWTWRERDEDGAFKPASLLRCEKRRGGGMMLTGWGVNRRKAIGYNCISNKSREHLGPYITMAL